MKKVKQPGFFDIAERTNKLTEMGDPLVGLNARIDWEAFRPDLDLIYEKERKSNADAKTVWLFREQLKGLNLVDELFA